MARIKFRQGVVTHPINDTTGEQLFLTKNGTTVDLNVVNQELVTVTFIHGTANYLYTEASSIQSAWKDVPFNQDSWIYWEINLSSGEVSRKVTTLEPIENPRQPMNSIVGQLWFNTATRRWGQFNGSTFREVVVVFAARVNGGTSFSSMSIDSPLFTGSQIGLVESVRAGSLVFNNNGAAIKSGIGNQFFTTEDRFLTGVPTGASLRINNTVITGEAICPIAAFQVIQYNDYNQVCLANPAIIGERLFGIVDEDIAQNETATFITEGLIYNELWDWDAEGANVNDPVYIDATGQITRVNLFPNRPPVGTIVGKQVIFFSPRLFPQVTLINSNVGGVGTGTGLTAAQEAQLNTATTDIQTNRSTIGSLGQLITTLQQQVSTMMLDISNKVNRSGDTLTGKLETLPTSESDNSTTLITKGYSDDLDKGYQADFTSGAWTNTSPREFIIPVSVHQRPLNTAYDVIVLDDNGNRIGIGYAINQTNGNVTVRTTGSAFAGTIRIK